MSISLHPSLKTPCPIVLLEHQVDHVKNIWNRIVNEGVFSTINSSTTGGGKTHCTLYIAWCLQQLYGTKVMVVAPSDSSLNNDDGWLHHAEENEIDIVYSTTYSSLRGGRGVVSHPWLKPDPEDKKNWVATKEFEKLCQGGLFIIFDEFHHTKNASMSHFACAALVKMAKKYRDVCRVALLSHTPGDKKDVYPQILRMAGIITSTRLFRHIPFTSEYQVEGYGLGELMKVCKKISPSSTSKINDMLINLNKSRANSICKELYDEFIRPLITFAMPKQKETPYKATLLNAFLETRGESLKLVEDGIALLSGAVGWNSTTEEVAEGNQWSLSNIGTALKLIERGKLASIARYVRQEVRKNKNSKFVISCGARDIRHHELLASMIYRETTPEDYKDIIAELREKNKDWRRLPKDMINYLSGFLSEKVHPHILNGSTPKKERVELIRNFQKNDMESWCLIISPGIGSESISLHDKYGQHPRISLIVSDFYHSRVVQTAGRVNRVGMKSDAKVMIVYSKEASLETRILQSMIEKTKVSRDLICENQEVIFPGEYPFWIEGASDPELEASLAALSLRKH